MKDDLGDRMKGYELAEAGRRLMTDRIPVLARLDGVCFSGFTRGLARPWDQRLTDLMVETAAHLVRESGAACGYAQSDEITLGWYARDPKTEMWFGGRPQKLCSVLAATATAFFLCRLPAALPEKAGAAPVFDCRAWNVPNLDEGSNAFLWREQDATKNSISMAAREHYSHRQLFEKSGKEMQEMLFQKGVNWNDFPACFKRGTYVLRRTVRTRFADLPPGERDALPPLHEARRNPDLEVERSVVGPRELPRLASVVNRAAVLFLGAEPETGGAEA